MSFAVYETSLQNARPVRLYQFQRGPLRWGYTSADRDITFNSILFRSLPGGISDDGIRQSGETSADTLTVTLPSDTDVAQMYRALAPQQRVTLTVFDRHFDDADTSSTGYLVAWSGQVIGVKFPSRIAADIQCQTLAAQLERTGLRLTWSRTCSKTLYDKNCKASSELNRFESVVSSLNGVAIAVPAAAAKPSGWFAGGYVQWVNEFGTEQRGIESHAGDQLALFGGTYGLAAGQAVSIFSGCDHLFNTCGTKFNNAVNYGGCPHMPGKSPFDGTKVF